MKLNENFTTHELDGQTVIVPTAGASFHGLVQGNKTLGAIARCLTREVTEEQIVDELCARFKGERADVEADVAETIRRLKEIGAIDE